MKYLYKTSDVVKFLVNWDCGLTAESIKYNAKGAEFLDSEVVKGEMITEIYQHLELELNKYTYIPAR
jgi:hypothetical protein